MCKVFRRAQPRSAGGSTVHSTSGFNMVVSDAGFREFPKQLDDAINFLDQEGAEVRRLVDFSGVTAVVLDFGIEWRDAIVHSDEFPVKLVSLAGSCGIALAISHYPARKKSGTSDQDEAEQDERRQQ
jgi:hypothetical protein